MKSNIHPKYYQAKIHCAGCNTSFVAGSTVESARVEICSNCHPFYTGQKRLVDTEGRVERFERRQAARKEASKPKKVVKSEVARTSSAQAKLAAAQDENRPKTLREMLQEAANSK